MTKTQSRLSYFIFTLNGLLFLILAQDYSWGGASLALALIFNPFQDKSFPEFSIPQKVLVVGQMSVAILLMGLSFLQLIKS